MFQNSLCVKQIGLAVARLTTTAGAEIAVLHCGMRSIQGCLEEHTWLTASSAHHRYYQVEAELGTYLECLSHALG